MGGSTISVKLDKPGYLPGEVVTGKVFVTLQEAIQCNAMTMKVTGTERFMFKHMGATQIAPTIRAKNFDADRPEIYREDKVLKAEAKVLGSGPMAAASYAVPFAFELPTGLPSSYIVDGEHHKVSAKASIKYKVTAAMDIKGSGFLGDPSAEVALLVLPSTAPPSGPLSVSESVKVKAMGLFSKGKIQVDVCAPTNTVRAGQSLEVAVKVDNSSSQGLKKVCVTLSQKVDMNVFMGPNQEMRALLFEQSYPAGQAITVPLTIPDSASAGPCTGKITKMWYQLKVEAVVDSMMTTNAEVKTTLNVLPGTKAPTAALPATPDQDRPQVFPEFKFSANSAAQPLATTAAVVA